jgi:hypothetical protein
MLDACHRHLTDFFANYLPFTPTSRDIELFETDLRLVSPFIMKAALKEVASGVALRYRPISEWRKAIFKVYNRKVSEDAQLFPVFHSFETAFRSTVAVELEAFYKQSGLVDAGQEGNDFIGIIERRNPNSWAAHTS